MTFQVHSYHGKLPLEDLRRMNRIAHSVQEGMEWEYNGSLDEFQKQWGKVFAVHPGSPTIIFITSYNNFHAR
jgi:hypothetical protein